jgi:hypothetical protein
MRDIKRPLLIMVVGEGNFGKSTLLNELAGRPIAPVSRLPKTWKVDIYQGAYEGEKAFLHWRSRPGEPQVCSIAEATAICTEQEELADRERKAGRAKGAKAWKSDLYQVEWHIADIWPGPGIALVDTPGSGQLRADTEIDNVFLYGSGGIQVKAQDAFEFYFYRADVVLWCLKATALNDSKTLERLQSLSDCDRAIIGILTRMDDIPVGRWDEAKEEAKRYFGSYIGEYHFSAAGANDGLRDRTITTLRECLSRKHIADAPRVKENATLTFVGSEKRTFLSRIDGLMDVYDENLEHWQTIRDDTEASIKSVQDSARSELASTMSRHENAAVQSLEGRWAASGGDPAEFQKSVAEALSVTVLREDISVAFSGFEKQLSGMITRITSDVSWAGICFGDSAGALEVKFQSKPPQVSLLTQTEVLRNLSLGGEGVGAGVAAGAAASLAGAALLGPIGLAAGLIGLFVHSITKKSQSIQKARDAITGACEKRRAELCESVASQCRAVNSELLDVIEHSLESHHGKNRKGLLEQAIEADTSLNVLSLWPENRRRVLLPSSLAVNGPHLSETWSCYRFLLTAACSEFQGSWDAACLHDHAVLWSSAFAVARTKLLSSFELDPLHLIARNYLCDKYARIYTTEVWSLLSEAAKTNSSDVTVSGADLATQGLSPRDLTSRDRANAKTPQQQCCLLAEVLDTIPTYDEIREHLQNAKANSLIFFGVKPEVHLSKRLKQQMQRSIENSLRDLPAKTYSHTRFGCAYVVFGLPALLGLFGQWWTFSAIMGGIFVVLLAIHMISVQSINSDMRLHAEEIVDVVTTRLRAAVLEAGTNPAVWIEGERG